MEIRNDVQLLPSMTSIPRAVGTQKVILGPKWATMGQNDYFDPNMSLFLSLRSPKEAKQGQRAHEDLYHGVSATTAKYELNPLGGSDTRTYYIPKMSQYEPK